MATSKKIRKYLIQKKRILPYVYSSSTDKIAKENFINVMKLDSCLMENGFKLSPDLFGHLLTRDLSALEEYVFPDLLEAVQELIGNHVKHNTYFIDFPNNVPDTFDFWVKEIFKLFFTGITDYGSYQHTYEDMVERHKELDVSKLKVKYRVIDLGGDYEKETKELYKSLVSSNIPLHEKEIDIVKEILKEGIIVDIPIPVRETKAVVNAELLKNSKDIRFVQCDNLIDILRLAVALSDGDVSLETPTRFKSFKRKHRRLRLMERLHPFEKSMSKYTNAKLFFGAVSSKGTGLRQTWGSSVSEAFNNKDCRSLLELFSKKPGYLVKYADYFSRNADSKTFVDYIQALTDNSDSISTRNYLSLLQHLNNADLSNRIFTNKKGTTWITENTKKNTNPSQLSNLRYFLNLELSERVPKLPNVKIINERINDVSIYCGRRYSQILYILETEKTKNRF
jgi:hypothetical protein